MLKATQDLLNYFKESRQEYSIVEAYSRIIFSLGNQEDIQVIESFFLENYENWYTHSLLYILKKSNTPQLTAQRIFENCFEQGSLKEKAPEELLQLLGYFKYKPALPLLEQHVFGINDYYVNQSAVLGLLHFDCTHLQTQITQAIEECYGKNLFKEFVPALVSKLDEKTDILAKLYELGSTIASTDCNGGIVLGFALSGTEGEAYFRKVYPDPYWELDAGSTGSVYWTYLGAQHLGITFKKLYEKLKATQDPKRERHLASLLLNFLRLKINAFPKYSLVPIRAKFSETYTSLYKRLFGWENPNKSNNLHDIARKYDLQNTAYELERLLEQKMQQEILLENIQI